MTHPDQDEALSVQLCAALDRYCGRFGETPPMLRVVVPPDYPKLIQAMDQAVATGRRLTLRKVFRIAGVEAPDDPSGEPLPSSPDRDEAQVRLSDAAERYRERFGTLPHTLVPGAEGAAAVMLDAAVARGRPLRAWTIPRALGFREPPPGSDY